MTDPAALASLHALCFDGAPRPWSEAEFVALLALDSTILAAEPDGFALGRVAGPEAELMTLAVRPEARRHGLGRSLVAGFEAEAIRRGAVEAFLEVAEANNGARRLYEAAGYRSAGFRKDYYGGGGARRIGALVLRKALAAAPA